MSSDNQNKGNDESVEVIEDYGVEVGRIVKIDLSSNGLLEVIASKAASD